MAETGFSKLYEELKRRHVIRAATLYVIAFWPIVQVVDILTPALGLPDSVMKYLVFAFFGAMPFVLIFAWLYDLNRDGLKRDDGSEHKPMFGSKTELTIIGSLCVVVIGLFLLQMNIDFGADTVNQVDNFPLVSAPQALNVTRVYDSIAVLPFITFSAEPEDQFFADGLTEELLNVLSRIKNLRVAARTSSFAYKNVNKHVQLIGNELNVATILEGSVRKNDVDDTIRVTAQLIDVATGAHLWSKTFDREFRDIFKIQDEISAAVAGQLKVTLGGGVNVQPRSVMADPQALIAYSMGQTELAKRTERGLTEAAAYFQAAIKRDPGYALAYAALADATSLMVTYDFLDADSGYTIASDAVDKALQLDPNLGIAWASRGLLLSNRKNHRTEAKQALKKAMELNPSYAMAYMWYASLLDDKHEALSYYQKAFELDPKSAVAGYNVANILELQGRNIEAMQLFSQIIEADPFYANAYFLVGRISDHKGRIVEAIRQFERGYDLQNNAAIAANLAILHLEVGDYTEADRWIELAELDSGAEHASSLAYLKLVRYTAEGNPATLKPYQDALLGEPIKDQGDYYLHTLTAYYQGDFQATIDIYQQSLVAPIKQKFDNSVVKMMQLDASIAYVYASQQLGHSEEANQAIEEITRRLDANLASEGKIDPTDWYRKSVIASITGDNQRALYHLQRAIDEGWRSYWSPRVDPAMQKILVQASFRSLLAGLETRLEIVREQFEMEAQFATGWSG